MTDTQRATQAVEAARTYLRQAQAACRAAVAPEGRVVAALAEARQRQLHGFAWAATAVEGMAQLVAWAVRLEGAGRLGEGEAAVLRIGLGEYLAQLLGGLPMSQNEIVRPGDLQAEDAADALRQDGAVTWLLRHGNTPEARAGLAQRLADDWRPDETLGDEMLDMVRDQFRQFTDERIAPHANGWHLADALIPDDVVAAMAELGVFGVCIDPDHGGLGLGKLAMCVVSEELSRGWIAAGVAGHTVGDRRRADRRRTARRRRRRRWLPGIASRGHPADRGVHGAGHRVRPRLGQARVPGRPRTGWTITGAKTWITHAARSDLMTVLARTDPDKPGHDGLSMFLAAKTRAAGGEDFPDPGLSGSEIGVLGYRGMKEYVLAFDGFTVAEDGLLGEAEGAGFRQLMATFEGARIQTAARAVGVARNAMDLALRYATERKQFGKALLAFPRVSDKLALMVVETVMARELTYFAARTKDAGDRCDIEAGMAKLLAARVAWSNADNAVQIHGGNGYAQEYPVSRVLCDARILNIFEGAAEIQANVVGRGLLARQM